MLVTLLTDFGAADYFVGAMKGALLSVCPQARVVDITHEIPAHDLEAGAFTLLAAYETFPAGTIHVAVVDPGVGSARRPLVVAGRGHVFVGPDNGLLGYAAEREVPARVFHVTNEKYFRDVVSATFHGRDVFAPIAGALSNGVAPEELGEPVEDFVRLPPLAPQKTDDGSLNARVIHVDRFGNCVTNITRADLTGEAFACGACLVVGAHEIKSLRSFFAEDSSAKHGDAAREAFVIWGSAGFLEIAVNCDSAARVLGIERGQRITVYSSR